MTITRVNKMDGPQKTYIKLSAEKVNRSALRLRFGKLLRERPLEYQEGWDTLVYGTLEAIESAINAAGLSVDQVAILQIKEKFGGLRIYLQCPVDVLDILYEAERMSLSTCIFCGEAGKIQASAWRHPACDPCESAYLKKRDY